MAELSFFQQLNQTVVSFTNGRNLSTIWSKVMFLKGNITLSGPRNAPFCRFSKLIQVYKIQHYFKTNPIDRIQPMLGTSPFTRYVFEVRQNSLQYQSKLIFRLTWQTWIGSQTTEIEWNSLHQWWIYGRVINSGFLSRYFLIVSRPLFAVFVMKYGFISACRIFDSFALFSTKFFDWFKKIAVY